jgi:hypothetical protein
MANEEGKKVENVEAGGKAKRTRKTIHDNPVVLIHGENILNFDDKELAEAYLEKEIKEGEKYQLFLLYKTYELEVVTTSKITSK